MSKEDIKIRKKWPNKNEFDPGTKVHKVKTDYTRNDNKRVIEDALDEMDEDTDFSL